MLEEEGLSVEVQGVVMSMMLGAGSHESATVGGQGQQVKPQLGRQRQHMDVQARLFRGRIVGSARRGQRDLCSYYCD